MLREERTEFGLPGFAIAELALGLLDACKPIAYCALRVRVWAGSPFEG